jgi:phosphohistidine swiveling domain-containing protein
MLFDVAPPLVTLDDLAGADRAAAGGKARACARLKRGGFPVPDGAVVLPSTPEGALSSIPADPWFDGVPAGDTFAVRSSGAGEDGDVDSFAGIFQTYLDVARSDLVPAVRACRASGESTEAADYRRARGLREHAPIGVLIQRMVRPVAAGVGFSINPVTGAADELVINASWGSGDALVSGRLDPDEFVLRKADLHVIWRRVGGKGATTGAEGPSLTGAQIGEVGRLILDVEVFCGSPQDVEWCHDGHTLWVLQARPITTRGDDDEVEWSRANLAEVLPDLTSPQALAGFETLLNRAENLYLGRVRPEGLGPFVKPFLGRLHVNVSMLRRVCVLGGIPPAEMLRSMGHAGAIRPSDEKRPRLSLAQVRLAPALLRMASRHLRVRRYLARHDAAIERMRRDADATDARALPDADLWARLEAWFDEAPRHMQVVLLLANVMVFERPLRTVCEAAGLPLERLLYPQLAEGERSVSAQQAFDLTALADLARRDPAVVRCLGRPLHDMGLLRSTLAGTPFLAAFEAFLARYGHRGRYESDWALPRYREDPLPLLRSIRLHLAGEDGSLARPTDADRAAAAAAAWRALAGRLGPWGRMAVLPPARWLVRRIKQYYVWRERVRSDMAGVLEHIRGWHLVLADRFEDRGWLACRDDYFCLTLDEVARVARGQADPAGLRLIVARRRAEWERYRRIEMPLLMRPSQLPALVRAAGMTGGEGSADDLSGQPVSAGSVEAEVVVLRDPAEFERMRRGAILVAPATDPSWTPLFTLASGVIVEVGGVLSHASTIAREYGLPAVANVRHATKRLRSGDRVRLDAFTGRIERITSAVPD